MRLLLTLFAILLLAAGLAWLAMREPGYVLLSYGEWRMELPLVDFLLLLLGLLGVLYLAARAIAWLLALPGGLRHARHRAGRSRARRGLLQGLTALIEGQWERAEKLLAGSADRSDSAVLHYLGAAHAAQRRRAHERRDEYLRRASHADRQAGTAVALTQADLQLQAGQLEEALATLQLLARQHPRDAHIKSRLARLLARMGDWDGVRELLPALRRHHTLDEAELARLELGAFEAQLAQARDAAAVQTAWKALDRAARQSPALLRAYVRALIRTGQSDKAEGVLRKALKQRWDDELVALYGELELDDPKSALNQLEQWLETHQRSPQLLAAAGRLSARARLWGKARSLLRESLHQRPDADTWEALARLYEAMGEPEEASKAYETGFKLLREQAARCAAPPPAEAPAETSPAAGQSAESSP